MTGKHIIDWICENHLQDKSIEIDFIDGLICDYDPGEWIKLDGKGKTSRGRYSIDRDSL